MRKIHYIFILLLWGSFSLKAQQVNADFYIIDSLDITKVNEPDKAILDSCLRIYHATTNELDQLDAISTIVEEANDDYMCKAYNLWMLKKSETLLKNNTYSKEDKLRLQKAYAGSLINVGYYADNDGDSEKALIYYQKGLKIFREIDDGYGIGSTLINIGHMFQVQGENEEALKYFKESQELLSKLKDYYGLSAAVINIGFIYDGEDELDSALVYYKKGKELGETINNQEAISNALYHIGGIYQKKGDADMALKYYVQSADILEEMGYKKGIASVSNFIGDLYFKQNNNALAKKYAERSLELSREIGYPENIRASANLLVKIYEKEGRGMDALNMHRLYIQMRDSMENMEVQKATVKQLAKFEYEKQKVIDDANHEKELAIEKETAQKQKLIIYGVIIGLLLVVVFLFFVFNRLQVTKKQKLVIEQQKDIVEEAHHQLEEKNKEITDSIQYAKRIQNAILPPNKVVKEYLHDSFIIYKPKDIVAGDFYWLETVSSLEGGLKVGDYHPSNSPQRENLVLFAAADCTGHGVPGAMVSVVCNNALNRSVREHGLTDPGEILNKTRQIVVEEFEKSDEEVKDGMDIALCTIQGNQLKYAGANNPLWIIRPVPSSADEGSVSGSEQELTGSRYELIEIKANKQPIGKFANPEPYKSHTIELQKGDSIYIFSDGYADQFGGKKGKKLKTANFKELLISIQHENMQKQKELIDKSFEDWKGELEQLDDVCVIGVRI